MRVPKVACGECGVILSQDATVYYAGDDKYICKGCLKKLADKDIICPNCTHEFTEEEQQISSASILLTSENSTKEQKANADTVLIHICPECKVMFFDDIAYIALRNKVVR